MTSLTHINLHSSQVVHVGGTPSQVTPRAIRVTSPRSDVTQTPNVIRVGTPRREQEEPRIIRVANPRTSVRSYILVEAPIEAPQPTHLYPQGHLSQITEASESGASDIPQVIKVGEPSEYEQRPVVRRTASGRTERTEAPLPHIIPVGSRAGRSEAPLQQIRITSPAPIANPPPQVIRVRTDTPEHERALQIVRVGLTKPAAVEAPPTIMRIPTAQGKPDFQPHVIRVTSPPAAVVSSEPHVVRVGTARPTAEEPQMIRITLPPRQIVESVR
jgi:hypothetical protein